MTGSDDAPVARAQAVLGVPAAPPAAGRAPRGAAVPPQLRTALDPWVRREGDLLLGGEPFALVRLTPAHAVLVDRVGGGGPVGPDPADRALVRALLSAAVLVPQPAPGGGPGPEEVTVVIPVRDRPEQLARLLAALGRTGRPGGLARVLVVDDASADAGAHARVAVAAGAQLVRREVSGGPAAARNEGLRLARTGLVAFVDSDCVPQGDWLAPLLDQLVDPLVGAAAPRIVGAPGERAGWLGAYQAERSAADRGDLPALVHPGGRVPFVAGAALLVRREAAGDGFDEAMSGGEDVDLVWRLADAGWHVRYVPASRVAHDHPRRTGEWLAQRASYGRSAADLALRHPRGGRPLAVSPWTAAAWAAPVLAPSVGGVLAGGAVIAAATALLARDLRPLLPHPVREAVALAGGGTLGAGRDVADALARLWWPALLAAGVLAPARSRRHPLALLAVAAGWSAYGAHRASRASREPVPALPWMAAKVLDDLAYGAGVWWGSLRRRTVTALLPDLGWRMDVVGSDELVARGDQLVGT